MRKVEKEKEGGEEKTGRKSGRKKEIRKVRRKNGERT